jgi:TPP-dependent pyruvate/acetoin dehydrogenase alpha subunit
MTFRDAPATAPAVVSGASTARLPPHGLLKPQLLEIYRFLVLTRALEERLLLLYRQNKLVGGLFRSLGQEGESVASAYALERGRNRDMLSPLIRNLGSMLVMGAEPVEVLRQYQAKATAPSRGRDLNIHFGDLERGFLGQISHLGDMVPVMAGVALSFKLRHERRVALVYVGDGATSTGACHEGLNFAVVQHVPLVVIGEYNHWAYATPPDKQFAVRDLADRARGYGIPAVTVDGNDVLAVYAATKQAVDAARGGAGVQFVEVKTYRRAGHAEHDDQRYVPTSELDRARETDPIDRYRAQLVAEGWAPVAELDELDARARSAVDQAVAGCADDPLPSPVAALTGVYASPPVPPAWYRSL